MILLAALSDRWLLYQVTGSASDAPKNHLFAHVLELGGVVNAKMATSSVSHFSFTMAIGEREREKVQVIGHFIWEENKEETFRFLHNICFF